LKDECQVILSASLFNST